MTAYKRLPLEGLVNARDLGGFPTGDGKITKYGVFIRSEVPKMLTEGDLRFLASYGVDMSLDLRSPAESAQTPSVLSGVEGHRYISCSMMNSQTASASPKGKDEQAAPAPTDFWDINWAPVYISILENGKQWVQDMFSLVAHHDGCILYHCFTGKDRTGLFTALLLGVCGVDKLDIMWDYSLSMTCLRPFYEKMEPGILFKNPDGTPDFTRGFYRTAPETMEAVLSYLHSTYGGVSEYVKSCGVSAADIEALVSRMTVSP